MKAKNCWISRNCDHGCDFWFLKSKQKLKSEDCKNCLEANQIGKETKYLEKNKLAADSLRENHKKLKSTID